MACGARPPVPCKRFEQDRAIAYDIVETQLYKHPNLRRSPLAVPPCKYCARICMAKLRRFAFF
eukprot:207186-Alexandrium_andersonii.AAC.1